MSQERGTGHLLSRRRGGGAQLNAYGGSLTLPEAALRNVRLERRLEQRQRGHDVQAERVTKHHHRRRLSLRQEILRVQQGHRKTILHHHQQQPSLGLPDWSEAGSLPDLSSLDADMVNCMLETGSEQGGSSEDEDSDDFELLKTRGSADNLQHMQHVLQGPQDPQVATSPLPARRVGQPRPHSSAQMTDNLESRRDRLLLAAQPRMYRRKSRSMSDLREVLPQLQGVSTVNKPHRGSTKASSNQSMEELVAAVRARKERYHQPAT